VAALIPEARAARMEADRLRKETDSLKVSVRESAARSRKQLHAAEVALSRVHELRHEPLPSPWSSLQWIYDEETLAGVLVSIS